MKALKTPYECLRISSVSISVAFTTLRLGIPSDNSQKRFYVNFFFFFSLSIRATALILYAEKQTQCGSGETNKEKPNNDGHKLLTTSREQLLPLYSINATAQKERQLGECYIVSNAGRSPRIHTGVVLAADESVARAHARGRGGWRTSDYGGHGWCLQKPPTYRGGVFLVNEVQGQFT